MRLLASVRRRLSPQFELDVSLDVAWDAETPVVALFGASGAGKSTLLHALSGLSPVDAGRIEFDGRVLLDTDAGASVPPEERGIAVVTQDSLLFPHLDVAANLAYAEKRRRGRAGPERAAVVHVLGLESLLAQSPDSLSGGQRQRVALARALLSGPSLLLLDEPVSALDDAARWSVLGYVERLVRALRVPVLYVSHRRDEVLRLAERAVVLEGGRVQGTGPAADLVEPGATGPVWNLLHARGSATRGETSATADCPAGAITLPCEVAGGDDVWCRLSSGAIVLRRGPRPPDSSARNHLAGRVVRTWVDGARVRVLVDCGLPLQVDVTPGAVEDLGLDRGVNVVCEFKAHALEVLR